MKKKSFVALTAGVVCIIWFCSGCGHEAEGKKVVARINDYVMILAELEDWIKYSPYTSDRTKGLEELLDLAIEEQILIQWAQRQGMDKRKSFMKTIERYWRQTLIKELTEKESQRIYKNVSKNEQQEAFKAWEDGLYKKANIEIYREVLKELEEEK